MNTHKEILTRYSILFSSHLFSILTPLIIFPLMTDRLGENHFGNIIFVQTLITYFTVLIDYDFNLWGVREVANGSESAITYNSVVISKLFLFVISAILYFVVGFFFFSKVGNISVLLSGVWVLLSYAFNPLWFYQAKERIWRMAFLNIISKSIFLIGSYFFIRSVEDAWVYNFFMGIGLLIPGLIVSLKNIQFKKIKLNLSRGFNVFISNFSILAYSNSSPLWISMFLPISSITEFSVGERIVFASRGFLGLYAQIIYPKICKVFGQDTISSMLKTHYLLIFLTFGCGLIVSWQSEKIVELFLRSHSREAIIAVRYMAFIPTIIAANIFPYQWLLAHSYYAITRNILIFGALAGSCLFPICIYLYGIKGAVLSSFVIETTITSLLIYYFRKLKGSHVST